METPEEADVDPGENLGEEREPFVRVRTEGGEWKMVPEKEAVVKERDEEVGCVFCFGDVTEKSDLKLGACLCEGTTGYHAKCLAEWLVYSGRSSCNVCRSRYDPRCSRWAILNTLLMDNWGVFSVYGFMFTIYVGSLAVYMLTGWPMALVWAVFWLSRPFDLTLIKNTRRNPDESFNDACNTVMSLAVRFVETTVITELVKLSDNLSAGQYWRRFATPSVVFALVATFKKILTVCVHIKYEPLILCNDPTVRVKAFVHSHLSPERIEKLCKLKCADEITQMNARR